MIRGMAVRLLVVDDKPSMRAMLRDFLGERGYEVITAGDGKEALIEARRNPPDLVLLDVMMPEMDGYQFLTELRRDSNIPVIMLTACGEEADRVIGLELGADDYITKPFSAREVKARIQAVLRRTVQQNGEEPVLHAGDVTMDRGLRRVEIAGRVVELSLSEFELLATLISAPGRVFTRQHLLARLSNVDGSERTIDVHVHNLRSKLEPDPAAPQYIDTVFGVGYRFRQTD